MTPWRFQREVENDFSSGNRRVLFPIYTMNGPFQNPATATTEADAEFICRAVNSHADLLSACETTLELIGDWPSPDGLLADSWVQFDLATIGKITNALNAAVDKAKGTQ